MAHDSAQLISKCKQTKKRGQTDKILHAAGVASSSSSLDAADGVGRNCLVCELGGVNKGTYLARFLDARFLASLKAAGFSVEDLVTVGFTAHQLLRGSFSKGELEDSRAIASPKNASASERSTEEMARYYADE